MNYFVFDDIDTRDYSGIYVSFSNVDKTPKRVYDVVNIPARNGAFYIDKQRFEDVEHSYYVIALTKAIGSQFINDLAGKVGHYRLEDSFNTDEFYSAVFTSGADIKITSQRDKNTFKVTFTRKPQRWLTSGETAVSVADGGTLDNPTPFASSPLLEVDGYGSIDIGEQTVSVSYTRIGTVIVSKATSGSVYSLTKTIVFDDSIANTNDAIKLKQSTYSAQWENDYGAAHSVSVSSVSGDGDASISIDSDEEGYVTIWLNDCDFAYGTSSYKEVTATYTIVTASPTMQGTLSWRATYNGSNTITLTATENISAHLWSRYYTMSTGEVTIDSTKSVSPVYIDLDIGEVYTISNSSIISLNNAAVLPSDLPTLQSGTTTINYDNTVTDLKVTPRWWKV